MMKFREAKLLLILLILVCLLSCEVDTRIRVSNENPPKLTFSGNGSLAQLYVTGPFTLDELKLIAGEKVLTKEEAAKIKETIKGNRILWQIDPGEVRKKVSDLSAITYGEVPLGFRQVYPKEGKPLPLLDGKYYSVYAPSYSAGNHVTDFVIQNGKAVEISIDRILKSD